MLSSSREGALLHVRIVPGAKKSQLAGISNDRLRIRIQAPPVEGKANRELVKFLAASLGLRKTDIVIKRGESSREKTLLLSGLRLQEARLKLQTLLPEE